MGLKEKRAIKRISSALISFIFIFSTIVSPVYAAAGKPSPQPSPYKGEGVSWKNKNTIPQIKRDYRESERPIMPLTDICNQLADFLDAVPTQMIEKHKGKNIKKAVRSQFKTLRSMEKELKRSLKKEEEIIKKAGHTQAMKKLKEIESKINDKIKDIKQDLASFDNISDKSEDGIKGKSKQVREKWEKFKKEAQPKNVNTYSSEPGTIRFNLSPEETAISLPNTTSGVAYMSNPKDPPTTPGLGKQVLPDDLASTIDAPKDHPEIVALATQLNHDAVKIYEYVRHNIDYSEYTGSVKGAVETLRSKKGNDYDTANLLIALYRASGIPCRYVQGYASMPMEKYKKWKGRLGTTFPQVWVEAYVPYKNYRGVGVNTKSKKWIPLDASCKQYEISDGIKLPFKNIPFDSDEYLSHVTLDYATDHYMKTVNDYLKVHYPGKSIADVPQKKKIKNEYLGLLPNTLPYKVDDIKRELNVLTSFDRHQITLELKNTNGSSILSHTIEYPNMAGKRLTISFPPATVADASIIAQKGGILNTVPGLINLTPILKLDGVTLTQGSPVASGKSLIFTAGLKYPLTYTSERISHANAPLVAGGLYSPVIQHENISDQMLSEHKKKLEKNKPEITNDFTDNVTGELLYLAGLTYAHSLQKVRDTCASLQHGWPDYSMSESLLMSDLGVKISSLGIPTGFKFKGYIIDAKKQLWGLGMYGAGVDFAILESSAHEHGLWEELLGAPSVSTVKIRQLARERNIPFYRILPNELYKLNDLNMADNLKYALRLELENGATVETPRDEIRYYDWIGIGFLTERTDNSFCQKIATSDNVASGGATCVLVNPQDPTQKVGEIKIDLNGGILIKSGNIEVWDSGNFNENEASKASEYLLKDYSGNSTAATAIMYAAGLSKTSLTKENLAQALTTVVEDPVNLVNGNRFMEKTDISLPAIGPQLYVKRAYNSQSNKIGYFGYGWTDNLGTKIEFTDSNNAKLIKDDGTEFTFVKDGSGNWNSTSGVYFRWYSEGGNIAIDNGPATTKLIFNNSGKLLSITDPNNNSITINYDGNGRLSRITHSSGMSLSFVVDNNNHITEITDPNNNKITYGYDTQGNLTSVTDQEGNTNTYTYYSNHNLASSTDANNNTTTYMYDSNDMAIQSCFPDDTEEIFNVDVYHKTTTTFNSKGGKTVYTYDDKGNVTKKVDDQGNVQSYEFDSNGNLIKTRDSLNHETIQTYTSTNKIATVNTPDCNTSTMTYDPATKQVSKSTDALGNETKFEYDAKGNQTKVIDGENNTLTRVFNTYGLAETVTDARSNTTQYTYNNQGLVASITDANAKITRYEYDIFGNTTKITDPKGNIARMEYDKKGRLLKQIDAKNNITSYKYDANSNMTELTNAKGKIMKFEYDEFDRQTKIIDPLGNTIENYYDLSGNLIARKDALGNVTTYDYDSLDMMTSTTDPAGNTTKITYNHVGKMELMTDAEGNVTTFEYDNMGRQTKIISGEMQINNSYDAAGRLIKRTDAKGNATAMTYDKANRVIATKDALNNITSMIYDGNGNVTEINAPLGRKTTITYNKLNKMIETINALNQKTTLTYDDNYNLIQTTNVAGQINKVEYDELNRPAKSTDALNNQSVVEYDELGNVMQQTDPLGRKVELQYDDLGRMVKNIKYLNNNPVETSLAYDKNGNMIAQTDALGNMTNLIYDVNNRLSKIIKPDGTYSIIEYTSTGNQRRITDENGNVTEFEYDSLGKMVKKTDPEGGVTQVTYDLNGNIATQTDPKGNVSSFEYDQLNRPVSVKDALNGVNVLEYDAVGNRISATDARGKISTIQYDLLNRPVKTIYPNNTFSETTYNLAGQVASVKDMKGNVNQYQYDNLGRLTQVTDPLNGMIKYNYNAVGNLVSQTDKLNHSTIMTYDDLSRLTKITAPDNTFVQLEYDLLGNRTKVTDQRGNSTRMEYNKVAKMIRSIDALNQQSRLEYDPTGNVVKSIDKLSRESQFAYDKNNRLTSITNPLGYVSQLSYDKNGNMIRQTDPKGNSTQLNYDALNRMTKVTYPDSSTVQAEYDGVGNRIKQVDQLGNISRFEYNEMNKMVKVIDSLSNETNLAYDNNNNLISTTDALNNQVRFEYDELNRQTKQIDPLNHANTITYDANNNVISRTDANGKISQYQYDTNNKLKKVIDANNAETNYDHDATGNLTKITDANGKISQKEYDALNRQIKTTDPLNNIVQYFYNPSDTLNYKLDAENHRTDFTYDNADRLTKKQFYDGTKQEFTYDKNDNITARSTADIAELMAYDTMSRLVTYTDTTRSKSIEYQYNSTGTLKQMADSTGRKIDYAYDAKSRLTGLTDSVSGLFGFTYDNADRKTTKTLANGVKTDYSYDNASQITRMETKKADGSLVENIEYSYDNAGNKLSKNTQEGYESYQYDNLYHLTRVNYPDNKNEVFTYDGNGNRLTKVKDSQTTNYVYNAANELTSSSDGVSYSYDKNGNTLTKTDSTGTTTFNYSAENHLMKVTKPDGSINTYKYDSNDMRIEKTDETGTSRFLNDVNGQVVAEFDGNNQLKARNTYSLNVDEILARADANSIKTYYGLDDQNSVMHLTDENGNVSATYRYSAFGEVRSRTGSSTQPFGYTAREFEGIGSMYYYRARTYDAAIGRFITADRYLGKVIDPQSLHRYSYVGSNPCSFTDPMGFTKKQIQPVQEEKKGFKVECFDPLTIGVAIGAGALILGGIAAIVNFFNKPSENNAIYRYAKKNGISDYELNFISSFFKKELSGGVMHYGAEQVAKFSKDIWSVDVKEEESSQAADPMTGGSAYGGRTVFFETNTTMYNDYKTNTEELNKLYAQGGITTINKLSNQIRHSISSLLVHELTHFTQWETYSDATDKYNNDPAFKKIMDNQAYEMEEKYRDAFADELKKRSNYDSASDTYNFSGGGL